MSLYIVRLSLGVYIYTDIDIDIGIDIDIDIDIAIDIIHRAAFAKVAETHVCKFLGARLNSTDIY